MRDSILEAWLTKLGLRWKYMERVARTDVVVSDAAKENIRLKRPLNDERVMSYAMAYEQGADFPAIVLWRVGKGFDLVNGMHRLEAWELVGRKEFDAYVLETDDMVVLEMVSAWRRIPAYNRQVERLMGDARGGTTLEAGELDALIREAERMIERFQEWVKRLRAARRGAAPTRLKKTG